MNESKARINAIIPIQVISNELKLKEFKNFCGQPMFKWVIEECHKAHFITDIYVSTHFEFAFNVIKKYCPYVKWINRPRDLHGEVELLEVVRHAAETIGKPNDIFMQIQVNKPLTKAYLLDQFISYFLTNNLNSLFQVQVINQSVNWLYKKSRRFGQKNFKSCAIAKMWDYITIKNSKPGTWGMGSKHYDYLVEPQHIEVDTELDYKIAQTLKTAGF